MTFPIRHQLSVREIKKNFEGKPLLKGISFDVASGEVLCLLGRSGSGKSTLLRIIAGIESADGGSVLWDNEDIDETPTHLRRFGLMFQDYALFPHRNVAENVAFGLRMQGVPRPEIEEKVQAALAQVNMSGFARRQVTDLSGGEQQRVALARALAPSPRLLMLDEPLAALDRALRQQLQQELREVLQRTGIPAIYVTHDQEEALALGDRLALLNEGEIVQIDVPEAIYRWPANRWTAQFLGMDNFLEGRVSRTTPLQVQTDVGLLQACAAPGQTPKLNEKSTLVITPTADFAVPAADGKNSVTGICQACRFKGENYQIQVRLAKGIFFSFLSSAPVKIGATVPLWLPVQNVVCLKNEIVN